MVGPAYKGVAATGNGLVRFNPDWFHKHPGDIDVVTHEVMHIVQGYPDRAGPGWITEGIADFVRYNMVLIRRVPPGRYRLILPNKTTITITALLPAFFMDLKTITANIL